MPNSSTSPHGAEHPRVDLAPPFTDRDLGPIAAILSARAGLPLEPWQEAGLTAMLARRDDGQWAAFEYGEICARQNGKSALALARCLAGFLLLNEQMILWTAHELKTAMRSWRDLRSMLRQLGESVREDTIDIDGILVKVNASNGKEGFERLDTGAQIRVVARSKGSGRGFSTDLLLIDEAFAYEQEHQDALLPTLAARPNAQIVYASSPPLTGLTGGPMFAMRQRADKGGDGTLAWRDWGLGLELDDLMSWPPVKRRAFLDDEENWAKSNPALGLGRVTGESIRRLRNSMSEQGFAREVLGCWPRKQLSAGVTVINPERWAECGDSGSRPGEALVLAVDVSPGGRSATISSAGRREDGRLHVKVVDYRAGTQWVIGRVKELVEKWSPKKVMLDPAGPAGALIADLIEAGIEPPHGRGSESAAQRFGLELISGQEMAQACGALVNDLTEDRIRHTDQDALNDAVAQATARNSVDGTWKWDRRDVSGDICPLVAVTLAAHGFRLYGSAVEERVLPMVAMR